MPETNTFKYHQPSEEGLRRITELRKLFTELHGKIEELAPVTRIRSVALTNLETAGMWAIKAIVSADPDSKIHNLD